MATRSFRELKVWQKAYDLSLAVYEVSKSFPPSEQYGLASQMKRAAVSVASNIAEGYGRVSYREKDSFYSIAHGSLTEVENQILIASGVGYIPANYLEKLERDIVEIHKMLFTLRKVNKGKEGS